jgi:hypothetical protein
LWPNGSQLASPGPSRCPHAERDEGVGAVWHVRIRATPERSLREDRDGPTGGQGDGPADWAVGSGCRVDRTGSGRPGNEWSRVDVGSSRNRRRGDHGACRSVVRADVKASLVMVMFVSPVLSCLVMFLRLRCVDKSAGYASRSQWAAVTVVECEMRCSGLSTTCSPADNIAYRGGPSKDQDHARWGQPCERQTPPRFLAGASAWSKQASSELSAIAIGSESRSDNTAILR